jgi:hypothetical protein
VIPALFEKPSYPTIPLQPLRRKRPLRNIEKSGRRDIRPLEPTLGPILFRLRQDETGSPKFYFGKLSGLRDGRFALVKCGTLEAEEMIRTLDANHLSTFHLSPSTWFGR